MTFIFRKSHVETKTLTMNTIIQDISTKFLCYHNMKWIKFKEINSILRYRFVDFLLYKFQLWIYSKDFAPKLIKLTTYIWLEDKQNRQNIRLCMAYYGKDYVCVLMRSVFFVKLQRKICDQMHYAYKCI